MHSEKKEAGNIFLEREIPSLIDGCFAEISETAFARDLLAGSLSRPRFVRFISSYLPLVLYFNEAARRAITLQRGVISVEDPTPGEIMKWISSDIRQKVDDKSRWILMLKCYGVNTSALFDHYLHEKPSVVEASMELVRHIMRTVEFNPGQYLIIDLVLQSIVLRTVSRIICPGIEKNSQLQIGHPAEEYWDAHYCPWPALDTVTMPAKLSIMDAVLGKNQPMIRKCIGNGEEALDLFRNIYASQERFDLDMTRFTQEPLNFERSA